jgi:two-component system response regulator YesN
MIFDDFGRIADEISKLKLWESRTDFVLRSIVNVEEEAIRVLKKYIIDVIIIVLNKKEEGKIKLINNIHLKSYSNCIILFSSFKNYSIVRQGFLQGAFDYIVGPITENKINELLDRVNEFLIDRVMNLEFKRECEILVINITNELEILEKICGDIYRSVSNRLKEDKDSIVIALTKIVEDVYKELHIEFPWLEKLTPQNRIYFKSKEDDKKETNIKHDFINIFLVIREIINKYKPPTNKLISTTYYHVLNNIDKKISLEIISKLVYVNKSYLSYIFKQETRKSFVDFLTEVKMDRAKILLMDKKNKIYQISNQIGYSDSEYFSKVFKSKVGVSPSEYRRQYNM